MILPSLVGLDTNDIDIAKPDYTLLLQNRIKLLHALTEKPERVQYTNEFYRRNPASFIQDMLFTYDPRLKENKRIPFVLFPRQYDYIMFLYNVFTDREDAVIEKCRDVGASWLNAGFTIWIFLYRREASILWGANRMDLVDKLGDMNALMERMDFMLQTLIAPLRPQYVRNWGKILNKDNHAQITGAGGTNIGRGGRETITFIDEAAFIENIDKVDASLSMNTDCQIWLSTPNGQNLFYRKRMGGAFKVFTFQWFEDPRKTQAWYDTQKKKLEPHIFAQEILIDYSASVENQMIQANWIESAKIFKVRQEGVKALGYDVADEGSDDFAIVGRKGSAVTEADSWNQMTTHSASTRRVWMAAEDGKYDIVYYDSIGVGVGAKVEFAHIRKTQKHRSTVRDAIGVNVGKAPTFGNFEDTDKKKSDMFTNLKAELWWNLRLRFQRTHDHIENGVHYPDDQMISMEAVRDSDLCSELAAPKFIITNNGKIAVENKKDMKKRGIESPNLADAMVMAFYSGYVPKPPAFNQNQIF